MLRHSLAGVFAMVLAMVALPVVAQTFSPLTRAAILRDIVEAGCVVPVSELDQLRDLGTRTDEQSARLWMLTALRNRGLMTEADGQLRLAASFCTPQQVDARTRLIDGFAFGGCTVSPADLSSLFLPLGLSEDEAFSTLSRMHALGETRMDVTERGLILIRRLCPETVRELLRSARAEVLEGLQRAPRCELPFDALLRRIGSIAQHDPMLFTAVSRLTDLPLLGGIITRFDHEARTATMFGAGCNLDRLSEVLAPSGRNEALVAALQPFNCRLSRLDRAAIIERFGRSEREFFLTTELFRMTGRLTGVSGQVETLAPEYCGANAVVPPSLRAGVDPEQHAALLRMFRDRGCNLGGQELFVDGPAYGVRFVLDITSARGALQAMIVAGEVVEVADRFVLDQAICTAAPDERPAVIAAFRSAGCRVAAGEVSRLLPGRAAQEVVSNLLSEGRITLTEGALALDPALCAN